MHTKPRSTSGPSSPLRRRLCREARNPTSTVLVSGLAWTAFTTRFVTTCCSCAASATTSETGSSKCSVMRRFSAMGRSSDSVLAARCRKSTDDLFGLPARAKLSSWRMICAMRSLCSITMRALLRVDSSATRFCEIILARPETTLSGVPSSCAMPDASLPTVTARSWSSSIRATRCQPSTGSPWLRARSAAAREWFLHTRSGHLRA